LDWGLYHEGFQEQLRTAVADPDVRGILLDMDSPGGEASGAMEAAAAVRQAAAQKRVVTFVNGLAASAGYAIASGATKIVTAPSGMLGSIGVVLLHIDRSEQLAAAGVKPTLIQAGAYKTDYSGPRALEDDARCRIQASVDRFYDLFVSTVAAHRGMPEKTVRATEGGLLMGRAAVEMGLADWEGTFEDARDIFDEDEGALGIGDTISKAEHEAALKATNDAARALTSRAAATAGNAVRLRMKAILGSDVANGRDALAEYLAYETDMPPDQALAMLAKASAAASGTYEARRGRLVAADVPANAH
jgi:signal peptide peptidase SppA